MSETAPRTLTVTLGFNGELRLLYPNGKSIDLPRGTAEARMLEILEGFRRSERVIQREIDTTTLPDIPTEAQAKRYGKPIRISRNITLEDLGL